MSEIRPMVITHPHDDSAENELTAAEWDGDIKAWVSNDGRRFEGKEPEDADDIIVVMAEPDLPFDLSEKFAPDGLKAKFDLG
jgi:hypothetical protein